MAHEVAAGIGVLGPAHKGVPVGAWGTRAADFAAARPALASMPTPLLTLDAAALAGNLAGMAEWCARAGVELAPHGKTTMAPELWRRQLDAGAWGITVATPWQLLVALEHGVPRVLVTGPVLDPAVLAHLAGAPARVVVWADGLAAVEAMGRHCADPAAPLDVLVELGAPGGRTGARSPAEALDVARAVAGAPGLRLAGVAGYEGALAHDASAASTAAVRGHLHQLRHLHADLLERGLLDPGVPGGLLVTAGGSAWFDEVAQVLAPLHDPAGERGAPVRVLLRSGAYLAHDDGHYRHLGPAARGAGPHLRAALHGWARVVSRPEPGLALVDAGKRDLPFDLDLPEVQGVRRAGTAPLAPLPGASATAMNDQLTFVHLAPEAQHLAVGDVLRLGLSHPCTAFDKWQVVPVLDDAGADQPVVVDLVRTVFG